MRNIWFYEMQICISLTHGGLVTHKCFNELSLSGSCTGLSPALHKFITSSTHHLWTLDYKVKWSLNQNKIITYNKMHLKLSTAKHSPLVFQYVRSLEHIKSYTLAIPSVRMAMKFPPNWISLMRFPWISINSLVISLPSGNAKGETLWSGLNICVRWCYLFYEWYHVPPQWQIDRN